MTLHYLPVFKTCIQIRSTICITYCWILLCN